MVALELATPSLFSKFCSGKVQEAHQVVMSFLLFAGALHINLNDLTRRKWAIGAMATVGVLISTNAKTQQVAMFMSLLGLMLPTILLSGFIFPIDNMPKVLQWFSALMPPRWFIVIVKNIMLKGTGLAFIWKETLILLGMTLFFILAAVRRFKIRLN